MDDESQKIEYIIENLINKFKENPNRWSNEKKIHYEFFSLLFDYFTPQDISNYFRWEYNVGVPEYGTGSNPAKVDLCFLNNESKFIAIEIEGPYQSPGDKKGGMRDEIKKCISKLRTAPSCISDLKIGYIIPFYYWNDRYQKARGYEGKTYGELIDETFIIADKALKELDNLVLIRNGVFFGN